MQFFVVLKRLALLSFFFLFWGGVGWDSRLDREITLW